MKKSIVTVLFLCIPAISAQAGEKSRWYFGAGAGITEAEIIGHDRSEIIRKNLENSGLAVGSATGSENDDSHSLTLRAGYRFSDYFHLEAGYQDLGDTDGHFTATVNNPGAASITGTLESEYWAASLAALGRYPVLSWLGIYGKLGIHHWDHELEIRSRGSAVSVDITDDRDGNDVLYGFGCELGNFTDSSFLKNVTLRLEWERFYGIEDEDGIDTQTLLLQYYF